MSIVAVHGPYTFGSKGIAESGPVQAVPNASNGLIWDFRLDGATTRLDGDFSWAFPGATPTPQNVKDPAPVTYSTAGSKTATLTVSNVGAGGANPYPPAGSYPMTITAVAGAAPKSLASGEEEGQVEGEYPEVPEDAELAGPDDGEDTQEIPIGFDPAAHTVTEVQEYADEHPDQVEEMYEAEVAGKNRSTLVAYLESMIPYDPGDYTVQEVADYAEENPDQLDDIITAEQAGKNRSTLVSQLEAMRP